jgi:REP element-mobilizing transposase RayT
VARRFAGYGGMHGKKLKLRGSLFHVIGRSSDKKPFRIELHKLWQIFSIQLNILSLSHQIRVHSFVLMGNHFHLLLSGENAKEPVMTEIFKHSVNQMAGEIIFDEFLTTEIKNSVYYQYSYKYIYRNPVSAGLCSRVEDYPFTSLRNVLGQSRDTFMIFDNMNLIQDPVRVLRWLNQPSPYPPEIEELNLLFS